jgi:hypothetical protein
MSQQSSFVDMGYVQINGCNDGTEGRGIDCLYGGFASCYGAAIITGCRIAVYASQAGFASVPVTGNITGNTTALSPSANTVANDNSYIKQ